MFQDPWSTPAPTQRRARRTVAALVGVAVLATTVGCGAEQDSPASSSSVAEPDGVLPDGVTVFDDEYAAVARLDPALLVALRAATRDAAADGVEVHVSSGWRSRAYQARLLDAATSEHGSRAEALRWVAAPATSSHVSGDAVDLAPYAALSWLSQHGAGHGLCQVYGNEPWHYELRPEAVDEGCPPPYADATHDPRMQR